MRNVNPGIHDESAFGLFDRWLAEQEQQANDVAERAPMTTNGSAHLKAVPEPAEDITPADISPADEELSSDETQPADESEPDTETESTSGSPAIAPTLTSPAAPADSAVPSAGPTQAARLPDAEARIEALLKSLGERRADTPREPRQGPPSTPALPAAEVALPPEPTVDPVEPEVDQGEQVAEQAHVQPGMHETLTPEPEIEIETPSEPTASTTIPADPAATGTTRSTSSTTKMLLTRGAAAVARRREARAAKAADRRLQEPPAQAPPFPTVVEFAPRKGTKRVLGALLLIALTATGISGWSAYQDQTTTAIGIAGTLAGLTAIIWATRAGSVVAKLTVRMGQLEVVSNGALHRFDLTSHYTVVDVVGRPGSGSWKVIFHRRGMAPFVVDASMVDPHAFMWVFDHYRPDPIDQF